MTRKKKFIFFNSFLFLALSPVQEKLQFFSRLAIVCQMSLISHTFFLLLLLCSLPICVSPSRQQHKTQIKMYAKKSRRNKTRPIENVWLHRNEEAKKQHSIEREIVKINQFSIHDDFLGSAKNNDEIGSWSSIEFRIWREAEIQR